MQSHETNQPGIMDAVAGCSQDLPVVIAPSSDKPLADAEAFLQLWHNRQDWLRGQLYQHGALLFRGFDISQQTTFASVCKHLGNEFLGYAGGNSPRTKLGSGVYTSTEYPSDQFIPLHNELSYYSDWPRRILFCCVVEPKQGGQTPLVDSRRFLQNLPPDLVHEFKRRGVRYIRNLHGGIGFGRSWQQTFESTDRKTVEQYAESSQMEIRWNHDGSVSLSNVRPATYVHPLTAEEVWFNQADQFHPSTIRTQTGRGAEMYDSLMAAYAGRENKLPQNATFGDDEPIPLEYLEKIREISKKSMVLFDWKQGDLLMVDNMLAAHGRMPFVGQRQILVSMFTD